MRLVLPDTVGLGVLLLSAPTPSVVHALLTLTPSLMLVFAQRLPLCFAFGGALMIVSQFEELDDFFFRVWAIKLYTLVKNKNERTSVCFPMRFSECWPVARVKNAVDTGKFIQLSEISMHPLAAIYPLPS